MSIRYPNSEHLPDSLLRELMETDEVEEPTLENIPKADSSNFIKKTLVGRNAETKRVIELSATDIEDITGISHKEMFGSEETGEKVAYIGAPWQGKTVMDSKRFFVFDYEYGEVANFVRDYDSLLNRLNSILYGEYSNALLDYAANLTSTDIEITQDERTWAEAAVTLSKEIFEVAQRLRSNEASLEFAVQIKTRAKELQEMVSQRAEESYELIEKREQERLKERGEHGIHHPVEGIYLFCTYLYKAVQSGLKDIEDYSYIVAPRMDAFKAILETELQSTDRDALLKQQELSILNELRLHKQTKNSEILVGFFPNLPLAANSMDRVICSYSISTHVIPEADQTDFESWLGEIQRVLKSGGQAYIFPMQQGFPFGRTYD